jgi:hypothetical protein
MESNEPAVGNPRPDHPLRQSDLLELPPPHHAMLPSREGGDLAVKDLRVEFWSLSDRKSTGVFHPVDDAP